MGLAGNVLSLLTVANLSLALFAYVALTFGWQIVYYRFFHPLAKFPGPFWASVTRLWIAKHSLQQTEVPTVYALAKEYGQSCRNHNLNSLLIGFFHRPRRSHHPDIAAGQRSRKAPRDLPPKCGQDWTLYHWKLWRNRVSVQHEVSQDPRCVQETRCWPCMTCSPQISCMKSNVSAADSSYSTVSRTSRRWSRSLTRVSRNGPQSSIAPSARLVKHLTSRGGQCKHLQVYKPRTH